MKRLEVNLCQSVLAALVLIVATVSPLSAQRDLPKQARTARATQSPKKTALTSPGGTLTVELQTGRGTLGWTVSRKGHELFTTDGIALLTSAGTLAGDAVPKSVKTRTEHETFSPAVPLKQAVVRNDYTEAVLDYGNFRVELRVMDNAVAHRFVTALGDSIDVTDERFSIHPAYDYTAHLQECRSFVTEYEGPYRHKPYADWLREGNFATVPALLSGDDGTQLLIGESDVDDYPRLFLRADTVLGIHPAFPRSPEEWMPRGDRSEDITREAPYIARTAGTRALPWRYVVVTDARGLIEQTVPVQLARRCALDDTSWIRLGQVSWEWWNGAAPYGPDVTFKSGCNYETYCYYADFAAKYGLRYILLDEGWAKDTRDPFTANDNLRLHDLIRHCDSVGVKILLWLPWLTAHQHIDTLFETYAAWGVAGVKIDFMNHSDQWMVNFYKRATAEAAKHRLVVDWHGAFTPAGLEQEYPNLISYEGVRGLEYMGNCRPDNTVWLPFLRNAAGPADFTPGAMLNMQPDRYQATRPNSAAMGTRAFQMALYIVLESGVQMLADNPTLYYQNDDCTRFITSVPTTWDETRALAAEAGRYAVVAKRKGAKWYVGAISGLNEELSLDIPLSFLNEGPHRLTAYRDGANAGYQAMHYNRSQEDVTSDTVLTLRLARNGGFAAVIE